MLNVNVLTSSLTDFSGYGFYDRISRSNTRSGKPSKASLREGNKFQRPFRRISPLPPRPPSHTIHHPPAHPLSLQGLSLPCRTLLFFPSPHSAIPSPPPAWACVLCRSATIWSMSGRYASYWNASLLPPATNLRQGNIFRSVSQEFCQRGRVCVCVWQGGMYGW